jgi:hypothetical protein
VVLGYVALKHPFFGTGTRNKDAYQAFRLADSVLPSADGNTGSAENDGITKPTMLVTAMQLLPLWSRKTPISANFPDARFPTSPSAPQITLLLPG